MADVDAEELGRHDKEDDCWILLYGMVITDGNIVEECA